MPTVETLKYLTLTNAMNTQVPLEADLNMSGLIVVLSIDVMSSFFQLYPLMVSMQSTTRAHMSPLMKVS